MVHNSNCRAWLGFQVRGHLCVVLTPTPGKRVKLILKSCLTSQGEMNVPPVHYHPVPTVVSVKEKKSAVLENKAPTWGSHQLPNGSHQMPRGGRGCLGQMEERLLGESKDVFCPSFHSKKAYKEKKRKSGKEKE